MAANRQVFQVPPLATGAFTREQQRALNDQFLQLSRDREDEPSLTTQLVTVTPGALSVDVAVDQPDANYFPMAMPNWSAGGIHTLTQTRRVLTLAWFNAPAVAAPQIRLILVRA